jgi:TPR repeat protein
VAFIQPSGALPGAVEDGVSAWRSQDYERARELWREAADYGSAEAQLYLGYLYQSGRVSDPNPQRAIHWYRAAAGQGVAEAQYQLGLMYEVGEGVPANYDTAERWYGAAIGQGFCPGELSIADRLGD